VISTLVTSVANSYVNLRTSTNNWRSPSTRREPGKSPTGFSPSGSRAALVSELELSQVKSEYEQALARIALYQKLIVQQENGLSVLLGQEPGPIPRGKTIDELILPTVPEGIPSDSSIAAPTLRAAEQDLIALMRASAQPRPSIPTISLTGAFGWASTISRA